MSDIIPEPIKFEWDKANKDKNLVKHGVSNNQAEQIFANKPLLVSKDKAHSSRQEARYQALGQTDEKMLLFVSFTIREKSVRIISIRPQSRKERKMYGQ